MPWPSPRASTRTGGGCREPPRRSRSPRCPRHPARRLGDGSDPGHCGRAVDGHPRAVRGHRLRPDAPGRPADRAPHLHRRVVRAGGTVTNPKLSRETDNGRYYEDPYDGFMAVSVTNALSEWSIPALAPGAAKETAEYIFDVLPKAGRSSRAPADREACLKQAKGHYKTVWERKGDLGT